MRTGRTGSPPPTGFLVPSTVPDMFNSVHTCRANRCHKLLENVLSVAHVVAVTYTSVLFFVSVPMGRFLAFGGYDIFCVQEHRVLLDSLAFDIEGL